jgi:murein DD-endopeptidase MepM/ murein hydrolase activator NlpD
VLHGPGRNSQPVCRRGLRAGSPPIGIAPLLPTIGRVLQQAQAAAVQHRRAVSAAIITLLGGFAITAFGIAPLAPDAADLPQRLVSQPVAVLGLDQQLEALASQTLLLNRSDVTRSIDTPETLLARLGVVDPVAAAFLRSDVTARKMLAGRGGKLVQARTDEDGRLLELVARYPVERGEQQKTHFNRLTLARTGGLWLARIEVAPLVALARLGSGTIRSTLFAATDEAQLPDAVAAQIAEIFATDIDFHRELRKGDSFSVVYESLTADGEPVPWNEGAGRVLAAEFVNGGQAYHAVWFGSANGRGGYFGIDGSSKRRTFLASPMEFSRVTSGFAMRFHPILQNWRAHKGVDYSAPIGTPVRSVSEGTVDFAGWQNGYGNVVQVQHANERSTLYAHLSRIEVKKGQRVEQGQQIGAVGMTGWSTGPHLHFEFRVGGQHQDPLSIAKSSEPVPLEPGSKDKFAELTRMLQAKLDIAETLVGVRSQSE